MTSLRARLLTAASLVLAAFFVLTASVLDNAYRTSSLQAQRDKLEGLIYALLAAASTDANGDLTVESDDVSDRRLMEPASGLQAALFDELGRQVWTSSDFRELPAPALPEIGKWRFQKFSDPAVFSLSYGLRWIDLADDPKRYTFTVLEDSTNFERQFAAYRRTLWLWLVAAAAGLLLVQFLVLRWGLSPIRELVGELHEIETGAKSDIQRHYPDELRPLASGLNAMIRSERNRQTRYRNALGDLAHSLKTPLAVLQGFADDRKMSSHFRKPLQDQVEIMQGIMNHQLRKAATAGRRTLSEPVAPLPIAKKITAALEKVYKDKKIRFSLSAPPEFRMRADSDDLYELLGNLLDNACKYGGQNIQLKFGSDLDWQLIEIEDDGPGFPENAEELLQRGVRADTQAPGQGIGLSAIKEIVSAYEGEIRLGGSPAGGAKVLIRIPS